MIRMNRVISPIPHELGHGRLDIFDNFIILLRPCPYTNLAVDEKKE
jgi:hypothetical protein